MKFNFKIKRPIQQKQIIAILLSLTFIFTVSAIVIRICKIPDNETYLKYSTGDVDGNEKINSNDALHILRYLKMNEDLFDSQKANGDVNKDNKLNIVDSKVLVKYCAGEIEALPYNNSFSANIQKNTETSTSETTTIQKSLSIKVNQASSWYTDDGRTAYKYSIVIKNDSSTDVQAWQAELEFSQSPYVFAASGCGDKELGSTIAVYSVDPLPANTDIECEIILYAGEGMTLLNSKVS